MEILKMTSAHIKTTSKRSIIALSTLVLLAISVCFADVTPPKSETALIIPVVAGTYFVYKDVHEQIHETPYAFAKIEEKSEDKIKVRLSKFSYSHQETAELNAKKAWAEKEAFFGEVFELTEGQFKELNIQKVISGAASLQNSSQTQHSD